MGYKSILSRPLAAIVYLRIRYIRKNALSCQLKVFTRLISMGRKTVFGRDHDFGKIHSYADFRQRVPLRGYEDIKSYIERVLDGEADVLWPGKPLYFSKTSGTTSGTKYIPISRQSIHNHINSARNALLMYIHETGKAGFLDGKLLFLSGSPELSVKSGIKTGRLSGIVNHHIPPYLRSNQVPTLEVNSIDDWELKIEAILDEVISQPLSLISGIPPWVQMFFDRMQQRTGKTVTEIFPQLSLYVYGGVNYEPYRARMEASMGKTVDTIETYPASEGFIAFQDTQAAVEGMLLVVDSGIFYEFVPVEHIHDPQPYRICLEEVVTDRNYAIILNTNAGLWGYIIGDTVKFTSVKPYRLVVTGRISHFISAFGEHVIGEEVDYAIRSVTDAMHAGIAEFTVAPMVNPVGELPYHEWFIEFSREPADPEAFRLALDNALQSRNTYYKDLITGGILQPLKITSMKANAFIAYMRAEGKLGGQNKMPRLANDRVIAGKLAPYTRQA